MGILEQFYINNYTWRLIIVQNLYELWQFVLSDFWAQNVLMPESPKIRLEAKFLNTPNPKIPQGTECIHTPKLYTTFSNSKKGNHGKIVFLAKT